MAHYRERFPGNSPLSRDRARQDSEYSDVRAYGAGYYDLPAYHTDFESSFHYMDGVLDRLEHQALDRLDALADAADARADAAWFAPGGPAELLERLGA